MTATAECPPTHRPWKGFSVECKHLVVAWRLISCRAGEPTLPLTLPLDAPATPGDVSGWDLANRELEVLQLLAAGQRNRNIAMALNISENTVKFHVRNLFRKLEVTSRSEAIALAHSRGLR
ncbi:response regulator transcription factor [Paenarthrobacter sp. NCHU4564]|uniref:response regulator transcription factor n=1 Tax=Paenarthrobacter sp. NCHU4564 TaxID=3451353 RepID=UPI003F9CF9B8